MHLLLLLPHSTLGALHEKTEIGELRIRNKSLHSSGEKLRENVLITKLEVTNRYLVSYEVDVLDHR